MGELSYMGDELGRSADNISKEILGVFAKTYNKGVDEWFDKAHNSSELNQYDASDYRRVAFSNESDIQRFMLDMQEQGIDVVATPFKLNGQYIAEIENTQEDGRSADEVIEDFSSRTFVEPTEVNQQAYEGDNLQQSNVRQLADVMLVNHLDTLGTVIHKIEQVSDFFDTNYGQNSNTDIFKTSLSANGEAQSNLTVDAGGAKVATVINNHIVIMDGKVVEDKAIIDNVMQQHQERMALANLATGEGDSFDLNTVSKSQIRDAGIDLHDDIKMSFQSGFSSSEKAKLDDMSSRLNEYSKVVYEFERKNEDNPSPLAVQEYNIAKKAITEFEQDTGIKIEAPQNYSNGAFTVASLKDENSNNGGNLIDRKQLNEVNQSFLERAEEAGFNLVKPNGSFDTAVWKSMTPEDFQSLGASETMQNVIYNINAGAKQLSKVEINAEAIKEAMYRQDYAVTVSTKDTVTVADKPSIFCAWSLGSLETMSNDINASEIVRNELFKDKMASLSTAEQNKINSFIGEYNAKHPDAPISGGDLLGTNFIDDYYSNVRAKENLAAMPSDQREALIRELHSTDTKVQDLHNEETARTIGGAVYDNSNLYNSVNFDEKDFLVKNFNEQAFLAKNFNEQLSQIDSWDIKAKASQIAYEASKAEVLLSKFDKLTDAERGVLIDTFGSETNAKKFFTSNAIEQQSMLQGLMLSDDNKQALSDIKAKAALNEADIKNLRLSSTSSDVLAEAEKLAVIEYQDKLLSNNSQKELPFSLQLDNKNVNAIQQAARDTVLNNKFNKLSDAERGILISAFGSEKKAREFFAASSEEQQKLLKGLSASDVLKQSVAAVGKKAEFSEKDIKSFNRIVLTRRGIDKTEVKTLDTIKKQNEKRLSEQNKKLVAAEKQRLVTQEKDKIILQERENYARNFADDTKYTDKQKEFAEFTKNALKLSDAERAAIKGSLADGIKKAELFKGTKLATGAMSPEKLVEMNAIFLKKANELGYNFMTVTGSFNLDALKALSAEDLQKLGINATVQKALVEVNTKGAFGHISTLQQLGMAFGAGKKVVGFLVKYSDGDGYNDISQLVSYTTKGVGYAKKAYTTARRLKNIRLSDLKLLAKKGGVQELKDKFNKPIEKKPKKPKNPKKANKQPTKFQKWQQEHYAKKQQKIIKKTIKKQNSVFAKMGRAINAAKKKVLESTVGKAVQAVFHTAKAFLIKAAVIGFGIACVLAFAVQIVALIAVLVMALIDTIAGWVDALNPFTVSTYKDTVAYQLYEQLYNSEMSWIADLEGLDDTAYDARNEITYTFDNLSLEEYLADKVTLVFYDENNDGIGDVKINPFWRNDVVTADYNSEYLINVTTYDGQKTFDISTNLNKYNENDLWADEAIVRTGVENGHTSNIKDILAMVDVMYQMEASENSDGELVSLLGMDKDKVNWDSFCASVSNFFAGIGNWIDSLFHIGDDEWKPPYEIKANFSYYTILDYAKVLFETSHQRILYLSVSYCDDNRTITNANGTAVDLVNEVEFECCPNPYQSSFPLKLNASNSPRPYLEGQDGTIYYLDEDNFDIKVTMDDILSYEEQNVCLWDNMEGTYYGDTCAIYEEVQDNPCWKRIEKTKVEEYYATGSGYDWYESGDRYWTRADAERWAKKEALAELEAAKEAKDTTSWYVVEEDTVTAYIYTIHNSYISEDYDYDYEGDDCWGVYCDVKQKYYTLTKYVYVRDCKGHNFQYCGGHVNVHAQGNVFSTTNDQLAITGMYEQGFEPTALFHSVDYSGHGYDFDVNYYYPEIKGKVIKEEVDYSSILTATSTGGGATPYEDPQQGTAVSRGLNLIVDGGTWGVNGDGGDDVEGWHNGNDGTENSATGLKVLKDEINKCRDIFDVDCCILKGCNIMPYKDFRKYEGWTADNMILAINRMAMDWYEAYGFDISMEIGEFNYRLSMDDIDLLCEGLKITYGSNFNAEREEAMREILSWVGRGHYSDYHRAAGSYQVQEGHSFLTMICKSSFATETQPNGVVNSIDFLGSCTAGNTIDFASYIVSEYNNQPLLWDAIHGEDIVGNLANCYPCDVISHSEYDLASNGYQLDISFTESTTVDANSLYNYHLREQSVIYVGTLSQEAFDKMKDIIKDRVEDENYDEFVQTGDDGVEFLKLTTGQEIRVGIPICVDLNEMGAYCGIFLRTCGDASRSESIDKYFERYRVNSDLIPTNSDYKLAEKAIGTTYYWLIHPDSRTSVLELVY